MNMQQIMQQAQRMQKDIAKKKEEIDATVFTATSGMVTITMNGKKELLSVKIGDEVTTDDVEMLQDMIVIAHKECIRKIDEETDGKLGQYASMMNGLM